LLLKDLLTAPDRSEFRYPSTAGITWATSGSFLPGGSNATVAKGDVFLWKPNQTWEDLWDVKREMTPP
jgi:hypothetical protein